jgi:hypothetical protein
MRGLTNVEGSAKAYAVLLGGNCKYRALRSLTFAFAFFLCNYGNASKYTVYCTLHYSIITI